MALKIVIAGGFAVGKTTFVGAVSEIPPLQTEEALTRAGEHTDILDGVGHKTHTTVSSDFGRITLDQPLPMVLLLFGTPGQERFHAMWEDLAAGAIGAVVMADTRRLTDAFFALDFFEQRGVPFVVAVNEFAGAPHRYTPDEVRRALELGPQVPVLLCDARVEDSAGRVLLTLAEHALHQTT